MPRTNNHPASFRDRSGYVFLQDNIIHRLIHFSYQQDYEHLIQSGLFQALVKEELLVDHQEINIANVNGYKVIRPAQIPLISYPYEWSFSQLKDAALLTLKIQKIALRHGMTLKDASAFNVQFIGHKAIFIDTLSFQRIQEGEPWVAYRQFCQHFLAPLAVMSYSGAPVNRLMVTYLDGMPLSFATSFLPNRAKLNLGLLFHLFLHRKAEYMLSNRNDKKTEVKRLSKRSISHLIDHLETTVIKLRWKHRKSTWGDYYQNTNYTSCALQSKATIIKEFLGRTNGNVILDIGANTSHFSDLAKQFAPYIVAADSDAMAVEQAYLQVKKEQQEKILPLLIDITNPSPAVGWGNVERSTFFERINPSTILALAIIHHLVITHNVTLPMLATFLSSNCNYLIIEFVPPSDSQVKKMLQSKNLACINYSQEEFETEFSDRFTIVDQAAVEESERIIYFMESNK